MLTFSIVNVTKSVARSLLHGKSSKAKFYVFSRALEEVAIR